MLSSNIEINGAKQLNHNPVLFASLLKPKTIQSNLPSVSMKSVTMLHGEPNITWKSSEVKTLIAKENLQYAIVEKFSYGKPDIVELRKQIPGQCGIKSECTIVILKQGIGIGRCTY